MMDRAFFDIFEGWPEKKIVEKLLCAGDDELLEKASQIAEDRKRDCKAENESEKFVSAIRLLRHLQNRRLFKQLISFGPREVTGEHECAPGLAAGRQKCISLVLQGRFVNPDTGEWEPEKEGYDFKTGARNRAQLMRGLERDFHLPDGSLAIYLVQVAPKIAEVNVAVDDVVKPFNIHPMDTRGGLSGGHLTAQITRFVGMWKLHFFIAENAKKELLRNEKYGKGFFLRDLVIAIKNHVKDFRDPDPERLYISMRGLASDVCERMKRAGKNSVQMKEEPARNVARHGRGVHTAVREDECPSRGLWLRDFIDGLYNSISTNYGR